MVGSVVMLVPWIHGTDDGSLSVIAIDSVTDCVGYARTVIEDGSVCHDGVEPCARCHDFIDFVLTCGNAA